jgi:hypothetical protein
MVLAVAADFSWGYSLSSWLDHFYDWARCRTLNTQIALLVRRGRLLSWFVRAVIGRSSTSGLAM